MGGSQKLISGNLNDNNISIDPSVGALKEYCWNITTSKTYNSKKQMFGMY
jgi:deoxyxylulose-5-phosphate synthase